MFNFWEAFTYIFKEKDWEYKFLLPFALQLLIVAPSILINTATLSNVGTQSLRFNDGMYTPGLGNLGFLGLAYLAIFLVSFIPYIFVTLWYVYENTQAGIYNRETKPIWKNNFEDTFKKDTKLMLNNFFYGLITSVVFVAFLIVFFVILFAILILAAAITRAGNMNLGDMSLIGNSILGVTIMCCAGLLFAVLYAIVYMWTTTGSLRLIASNTFGEGLKFGENWQIAMRHKRQFTKFIIVIFIGIFILAGVDIAFNLLNQILVTLMPFLTLVFEVLTQIVIGLFTTYLTFFVYPRLMGQFGRALIKTEHKLKFIKL